MGKKFAGLLAVALLLLTLGGSAAADVPAPVVVVAHRCNGSVYTENTQKACVNAVAAGSTVLEVDVRWTSDGVPVLLHDDNLGRFGQPTIKIATVTASKASTFLSPQHDVVTSLTQMGDLTRVTSVQVQLEPKITPTAAQWDQIQARFGSVKSRVTIESFSSSMVTAASSRGWRTAFNSGGDVVVVPSGADEVHQAAGTIDATHVAGLASLGIPTLCYGCDTPEVWAAMKAAGVSGFITDDPRGARAWLATH